MRAKIEDSDTEEEELGSDESGEDHEDEEFCIINQSVEILSDVKEIEETFAKKRLEYKTKKHSGAFKFIVYKTEHPDDKECSDNSYRGILFLDELDQNSDQIIELLKSPEILYENAKFSKKLEKDFELSYKDNLSLTNLLKTKVIWFERYDVLNCKIAVSIGDIIDITHVTRY